MNRSGLVFITSEIHPFSKSGGLGDVLGILPPTLAAMGHEVSVITPLYGRLGTTRHQIRLLYENCTVGYPWPDIGTDVYVADYHGVHIYFLDRPEYFDRRNYYCTYHGDYFDNCERFIFFSRASLAWLRKWDSPPAVLHAHDWHCALVPAFLHFLRLSDRFWQSTGSVLTIHNLAFQGQYSARLFWESGLPAEAWSLTGAEYHGSFNMLKTGIAYADRITTVSPSYAREILTTEFGCGMEGILRYRSGSLTGILNGVDYDIWDPARDRYIAANYTPEDMAGKMECKTSLLYGMGLHPDLRDRPVLGFIGRLRDQKGIDLLIEVIDEILALDVGLVVLGEGALETETQLGNLVEQYPGLMAACIGYTEEKAHQIIAGADILLMPSRYEPCGLTQLYSLRYGTLPVTTRVGGLVDTLIGFPDPEATGFTVSHISPGGLLAAVRQAVHLWREDPQTWRRMQDRAMRKDFSWQRSAWQYLDVYRELGY
jgi:starch synthase